MYKNEKVISLLSIEQKINLLTDIEGIDGETRSILGVDKFKIGYCKDYFKKLYPNINSIVNSFDLDLIKEVAGQIADYMKEDGITFAVLPSLKPRISPYRNREFSEDEYLSKVVVLTFVNEFFARNIPCSASGCYLTNSDLNFIDKTPNYRFIYENLLCGYYDLLNSTDMFAVMSDSRTLKGEYKNFNLKLQKLILKDNSDAFVVNDNVTKQEAIQCVLSNIICVKSSKTAIEYAYNRYKSLYTAVESNLSTIEDLQAEIDDLKVLTDENIDLAVDNVISFLLKHKKYYVPASIDFTTRKNEELSKRATLESIVLLKNQNDVLPIKNKSKVLLVGDIAFDKNLENSYIYKVKNYLTEKCKLRDCEVLKGYDIDLDRSEEYINEVGEKCRSFDYVILFLGLNKNLYKRYERQSRLVLPANQLALIDSVKDRCNNLIGVVSSNFLVDYDFGKYFSSIVLAPIMENYAYENLAKVICGEENPCGKIAYTAYCDVDSECKNQKLQVEKYNVKVGPLFGYRKYDTYNLAINYPFGSGTSYSNIIYKKLNVKNGNAVVSIKNKSHKEVVEIVQAYIGYNSKNVIMPKKRLCGFTRVQLRPNQEKTVYIPINVPKVYINGNYCIAKEKYQIYVGSNICTSQFAGVYNIGDVQLKNSDGFDYIVDDNVKVSQYFQNKTNILTDNFGLEVNCKFMKKSEKNGAIIGFTIALAVAIAVFNTISNLNSGFLNVIAILLGLVSIRLIVVDSKNKAKLDAEEKAFIKEENDKAFSEAKEISNISSNEIFDAEFDGGSEVDLDSQIDNNESLVSVNLLSHINMEMTFNLAIEQFCTFCNERGLVVDLNTAQNIFSSLASSRLFVTTNLNSNYFNKLVKVVAEYFKSQLHVDVVSDNYLSEQDALQYINENNIKAKTNLLYAIEDAKNENSLIHIVGLDNVKLNSLQNYFNPLAKYVSNPKGDNNIIIHDDSDSFYTYNIPENMWFMLNLKGGESIENLPLNISGYASVSNLSFRLGDEVKEKTEVHDFTYYQMDYLIEKVSNQTDVSEGVWKKFDRLEEYVLKFNKDFNIGNKIWRSIEKQINILVSLSNDVDDCVDYVIATKLLPYVVVALKDKLSNEDVGLLETLSNIFGEENISKCRETLQEFGMTK